MTASRDWTAENFAADLAFDEAYHAAKWEGSDILARNATMQTARYYFRAGWRACVTAQKSLDYCIVQCRDVILFERTVTDRLRDGWQLAGSVTVAGDVLVQSLTRSD